MKNLIGKKVLITTNNWFFAPDGREYRALHGTLKSIKTSEQELGFVPNRVHTNWFVQVGNFTLAGCEVLHVVECETINKDSVFDCTVENGKYFEFLRMTRIYCTE